MSSAFIWIFLIALLGLALYEIVSAVLAIKKKIEKKRKEKNAQPIETQDIDEEKGK